MEVKELVSLRILLREVKEDLNDLKISIEIIKKDLHEIKENSKKMSKHVDFVETIYEQIKRPFHYVLDKIDRIQQITN